MPFPLHLGWRQRSPRNPRAGLWEVLWLPRPSCNGTSQVFRGLWPFDPQSKGFYACRSQAGHGHPEAQPVTVQLC